MEALGGRASLAGTFAKQTLHDATLVGAGVLLCDGRAVDEQTIKAYIESQKWDEDDQGFMITAPPSLEAALIAT